MILSVICFVKFFLRIIWIIFLWITQFALQRFSVNFKFIFMFHFLIFLKTNVFILFFVRVNKRLKNLILNRHFVRFTWRNILFYFFIKILLVKLIGIEMLIIFLIWLEIKFTIFAFFFLRFKRFWRLFLFLGLTILIFADKFLNNICLF